MYVVHCTPTREFVRAYQPVLSFVPSFVSPVAARSRRSRPRDAPSATALCTALCLLLAAPAFGWVTTAPLAPRLLMRRSSRLVAVAGAGAPKPSARKPSALEASAGARTSPAQAATLTVPKLKAELSELGLSTSGLKAVLLERLQAALGGAAAATALLILTLTLTLTLTAYGRLAW